MKKIDLNNWVRKDHFEFFKDYDDPFYNVCADVEVTGLLKYCKENNLKFFITSLYLSLQTINEIDEFKYRIKDDEVYLCENVNAGSTVFNENQTFGFAYYKYYKSFLEFYSNSEKVLNDREANTKLIMNPFEESVVFYSVLPWISFSSMSHPKKHLKNDSIPRLVFGKYSKKENKLMMPVSVEAHHSFVDGFHIGKFFELFNEKLTSPEKFLV